jgi:ERCC4-related helicase
MLLDNEHNNLKIHEWISTNTQNGKISVVTGYFTIGALAYLAKQTQNKIDEYRFILGDIVNDDSMKIRTLDLLSEEINVDAALKLSRVAREAVAFLELEKVQVKTLEPNFCHAKLYLHKNKQNNNNKDDYYISGSSNLTEAGIGLNQTNNNVELNISGTGMESVYKELSEWFENLWNRPQAHKEKIIKDEKGNEKKIDFKKYLIEEIKKIFVEYTPKQLYYKILFELFGENLLKEKDDADFNRKIGRLENTVIYNALYEFQRKGALSLIKMLQKYNGAILADAVGLGKTWTALAVMKFYQLQGHEIILICPKKLQHNWKMYLKNQESKFERDGFEYFVRFHTDLTESLMKRYSDRADNFFINDKPKLFVIDESHNMRNDKSKRYKYLTEEILSKNEDVKMLMLSATPINNSLLDIRNQFKLIVAGKEDGFKDNLDVGDLRFIFKNAQQKFNEWTQHDHSQIGDLVKKLSDHFFKLIDALTVARTRKMIEGLQNNLVFPKKERPINRFVTPTKIGNYNSFEELFDHFPPMLSGYQPACYIDEYDDKNVLKNEKMRDRFLVKMMYILLVKRLESSWFSFRKTAEKVLGHHQNALDKIEQYQQTKQNSDFDNELPLFDEEDEIQEQLDDFELGNKRKIKLIDIDKTGKLKAFKKDLKTDIEKLDALKSNLDRFAKNIENEIKTSGNHKSIDDKLQDLIEQIKSKREKSENNCNPKVVIFTVYTDTAEYLYDQLKARGFDKIAFVSGERSAVWNEDHETKKYEPILERFAPFTKLFREKEWKYTPSNENLSPLQQFEEWKDWIADNDSQTHEKLKNPIDILISTDVLSEGQNLQDCDMVINYDIHWNPVRVIQRFGRIDRLGSPNEKIFGINYWPSENINNYLNLQSRIEKRMATMRLAGSEVPEKFTDSFNEKIKDEELERRQNKKMLQQMETTWDDIETEKTLGFDDLSLETFRQELMEELKQNERYYKSLPNGIYTGFKIADDSCNEEGIIVLLKSKFAVENQDPYELIYINKSGESVLLNRREVLDVLAKHKDEIRFVPDAIENGDTTEIQTLSNALLKWITAQASEESIKQIQNLFSDGSVMQSITTGQIKNEEKYQPKNFDLITWFIISK